MTVLDKASSKEALFKSCPPHTSPNTDKFSMILGYLKDIPKTSKECQEQVKLYYHFNGCLK